MADLSKAIDVQYDPKDWNIISTYADLDKAIKMGLSWSEIEEVLPMGIDSEPLYMIWKMYNTTLGRLLYG